MAFWRKEYALRLLAMLLAGHAAGCATHLRAPTAGELRRVRIEADAPDVEGSVWIDGRRLCAVPCTVLLRPEQTVEIDLASPREETVALAVPPPSTGGATVRVVVHPTRGHPGTGNALIGIGSAPLSLGLATAPLLCGGLGNDDACAGAGALLFVGFATLAVGIILSASGSFARAEVTAPSAGARVTPNGFEIGF